MSIPKRNCSPKAGALRKKERHLLNTTKIPLSARRP
nr:MAG TPA: hypothetical protein [Caudoviricetes sp.]